MDMNIKLDNYDLDSIGADIISSKPFENKRPPLIRRRKNVYTVSTKEVNRMFHIPEKKPDTIVTKILNAGLMTVDSVGSATINIGKVIVVVAVVGGSLGYLTRHSIPVAAPQIASKPFQAVPKTIVVVPSTPTNVNPTPVKVDNAYYLVRSNIASINYDPTVSIPEYIKVLNNEYYKTIMPLSNTSLPEENSKLTTVQLTELASYVNYTGKTPFVEAFTNLSSNAQKSFFNMSKEYFTLYKEKLNVSSAYRNGEYQKEIKALYGAKAATSCFSGHQLTAAIDIDRSGDNSIQVERLITSKLLYKHQWYRPKKLTGESWHIEYGNWNLNRYGKSILYKMKSLCEEGKTANEIETFVNANGGFSKESVYREAIQVLNEYFSKNPSKDEILYKTFVMFALRAESNYGGTMVSHTGALGWLQFTNFTADIYHLRNPFSFKSSIIASINLAQDNKATLGKLGIEPEAIDLYFSHMIGAVGSSNLKKVLNGSSLDKKEEDQLRGILFNNLPKRLIELESINKDTTSLKEIAHAYSNFYLNRFSQYFSEIQDLGEDAMSIEPNNEFSNLLSNG
jgi:hypothetical protein